MEITVDDVKNRTRRLCEVIIANEVYFCELDSVAGDGDFGMSLSKGFKEILAKIEELDDSSAFKFLRGCSMLLSEYCGGASGPIWSSAFNAAAQSVKAKNVIADRDIVSMFKEMVAAIQKRGGAKAGDKTLLDALIPATEALEKAVEDGRPIKDAFESAAKAAVAGAELTKTMVASKGRASYVGARSLNYPDAGATAIGVILSELTS
jgi:dihydroxyacetone kinase